MQRTLSWQPLGEMFNSTDFNKNIFTGWASP
jgi:hypothetical protein